MEHVEQDPDFIALSRQFKATAMELISILEQVNIILIILSELLTKICDSTGSDSWNLYLFRTKVFITRISISFLEFVLAVLILRT